LLVIVVCLYVAFDYLKMKIQWSFSMVKLNHNALLYLYYLYTLLQSNSYNIQLYLLNRMGTGASVSRDEVSHLPQYTILGGDAKFDELKGGDGKVELAKVEDPYLIYGGAYLGDIKDTADFKYVTYTSLPNFTPKHKSLMSKVLTADLFEKLKNVKSSKGYSISNAIMTGVVTPHLGVGCTAGDEECWDLFKELYYPVIKGWHGYDAYTQKHPVDLDPSHLKFTPEQRSLFNHYVVSTRIRAARNISGFALPAGATAEERAGVEHVLKQAFAGLGGELSGTYYELGKLTGEQTQFLLDRGFLFQIPTSRNLLTGAGAARSWPDNRGIFHNDTQTALCWVNEEDHCRIISMELGGDIPSVFTRFCALSNALKESAEKNGTKLMWNETLGFLGTCPSNLGTGLRASVMVKLPQFNKLMEGNNHEDKELLETVCSAYDLQPRGSAGEHSAALDAKFDVSNKQRLGYSEVELVQKMIDGVMKVIKYERLLEAGASPADIRAIIASEKKM
jgi:creatine kinase